MTNLMYGLSERPEEQNVSRKCINKISTYSNSTENNNELP